MMNVQDDTNPYRVTIDCEPIPVVKRTSRDLYVIPAGVSGLAALMYLSFVPIAFHDFVYLQVIKNELRRSILNIAFASVVPVYLLYLSLVSFAALNHWAKHEWKPGLVFTLMSFLGIYSVKLIYEYVQ